MNEEEVRKAFAKVKEDISFLISEISNLKEVIKTLKEDLNPACLSPTQIPTQPFQIPPNQQIKSTFQPININKPTDILPSQALGSHFSNTSIGNEGVPTNQQTNQQTNQHSSISTGNPYFEAPKDFQQVSHLLDSLDAIKKNLRLKFKKLTKQEMVVFSTIYSVEETSEATYSTIALKLGLSESSIRDYTNKLIEKGVPITKEKQDNKKVILHISPDLRKIATLDTILKLREI